MNETMFDCINCLDRVVLYLLYCENALYMLYVLLPCISL